MPEQIQSASMTADWEEKLLLIEKKDYTEEDFMREIMEMVSSLIKTYEKAVGADILLPKDTVSFGKCPVCGKPVIERAKSFFCSNRECKMCIRDRGL